LYVLLFWETQYHICCSIKLEKKIRRFFVGQQYYFFEAQLILQQLETQHEKKAVNEIRYDHTQAVREIG
jgi:hypothetical protein